ncbi:MAG: substrate-binding domain-containing protein, partial [Christensenellales bacterium]
GMEVPIQQAIDEGITVVNFDIAIEADGVYRVSGDNEGMGKDAAEYIIDKVGTEGTVVVLDVPTSGSVAELRKKGFTETMAAEAPNMVLKEYATEFTREAGLADMADILTANPQIDAVFSMDDETSIGALQAIRDAGRTDIKVITGGGGCQEYFKIIKENESINICSALYSPLMVRQAVDMAISVLKGETVDPVLVIPTTIVDRSNVDEYLDPNNTVY